MRQRLPAVLLLSLATGLGVPTGAAPAPADTAVEWLRRSQAARFPGRDMRASFVMYVEQQMGRRLKRRGTLMRLTRPDGLADRLLVVEAPPQFAGLALLSQDRTGAPEAQWLYMPAYRRARRVALQAVSDRFIGSDFVYADFGRVRVEAATHRLRDDRRIDGRSCAVVESVTGDPTLPYHTLVSVLDRDNALPLRLEYFDEKGTLARVGTLDSIAVIGEWPTPVSITLHTTATGSRSTLKLSGVRYDVGLDPSHFTVESLENP
jgi:hypothetical protein